MPVMMDKSIYGLADIDIAGAIPGVGFVKLKLKKLASLDLLRQALARMADHAATHVGHVELTRDLALQSG